MTINFREGKKTRKGKNVGRQKNKSLRLKDLNSLELYAKVVKRLGGSPPIILVLCEDGKERKCVIRGKFAKKVWMHPDDYVLITCNSEAGDSGEVSCKYNSFEVSQLETKGEITSQMFNKEDENSNITFTNDKVTEDKVDEYYSSINTDVKNNEPKTFTVFGDSSDELDFEDI